MVKVPEKPNEDAIWNNGSWVIPPVVVPSTITAR